MVKNKINIKSLEDLKSGLQEDIKERKENGPSLPKTTYDIIVELKDTIDSMRADGWTDAEICEALNKRGVEISASTMSRYMQKIHGASKGRGGRRPKVQKTETNATATEIKKSSHKDAVIGKPSMANFESREAPLMDA